MGGAQETDTSLTLWRTLVLVGVNGLSMARRRQS
jgi:hypothetical protein